MRQMVPRSVELPVTSDQLLKSRRQIFVGLVWVTRNKQKRGGLLACEKSVKDLEGRTPLCTLFENVEVVIGVESFGNVCYLQAVTEICCSP